MTSNHQTLESYCAHCQRTTFGRKPADNTFIFQCSVCGKRSSLDAHPVAKITTAAFERSHGELPALVNHKDEASGWAFCRSTHRTAFSEELFGDKNVFYGTWDELVDHLDAHLADGKLVAILP